MLHTETKQENSFTATGRKLAYHWPVFAKFRDTGYGSILRATMTNHQLCSSHCHYCSTVFRKKSDSISIREAKAFVETLYADQAQYNRSFFSSYNDLYKKYCGSDIRLRGLILSGGGQPNLWPDFEEFVNWLTERDIDLGLITNGFPKNVSEEVYTKFKWIRISITPDDASPHYPSGLFEKQYIPDSLICNPAVTVGYSYVYGEWTPPGMLERIDSATERYGFAYGRLLVDCNLPKMQQLGMHRKLSENMRANGLLDGQGNPSSRLFHQLKYHGAIDDLDALWNDGQCFLQVYNTFWDTSGHADSGKSHCYPCDSVTVLADESTDSARKFDGAKWGTCYNDDVYRLFTEKVRPYFDPRKNCRACLFTRNNLIVKELLAMDDTKLSSMQIEHPDHVNFP